MIIRPGNYQFWNTSGRTVLIREKKDSPLETWSLYFVFTPPSVSVPSSRNGTFLQKVFPSKTSLTKRLKRNRPVARRLGRRYRKFTVKNIKTLWESWNKIREYNLKKIKEYQLKSKPMKIWIIKEQTAVIWMSLEIPNVTGYKQFVSCNIRLQLGGTNVLSHFLVCAQCLTLRACHWSILSWGSKVNNTKQNSKHLYCL